MMAPAKPLMRVSGGTPAGFEDFVPLNPWGRAMPKIERKVRPALYQVVVRDRRDANKELRLGPKVYREFAEMFCKAIEQQIAAGAEKRWSDPIVLQAS